jgi:ribosomal protein L13E
VLVFDYLLLRTYLATIKVNRNVTLKRGFTVLKEAQGGCTTELSRRN